MTSPPAIPRVEKGPDALIDPGNKSDIRRMVDNCLITYGVSNVTYKPSAYDKEFHDTCLAVAVKRGYPLSADPDTPSMLPYFRAGVSIASTAYAHLPSKPTQVFIGFYNTFIMYLDELYEKNIAHVYAFTERYVRREHQTDPVLECFARLLDEAPQHYGRLTSAMVVTSTFDYVNSVLLDYETQGLKTPADAADYPAFHRQMSGVSRPYAFFAFPSNIDMREFIHAVPIIIDFLNYTNDILSFWKEELAGETANYIPMIADAHGESKMSVFERLGADVVSFNEQVSRILAGHDEALEAWQKFSKGYIVFHTSTTRYRLEELMLN